MNKRFLLLMFAGCVLSNTSSNAMELNNAAMGKVAGTLLAGGAVLATTEWLSKQPFVNTLCNKANLNPCDVKRVINLSSACIATSLFTKKETSDSLVDFAWKAPLIGLAFTLSNTRIAKTIIGNVPFGLGNYLVCSRPHKDQVPQIKEKMIKEIHDSKTMSQEEKETSSDTIAKEIIATCQGSCDECQWTNAVKIVAVWTFAKYAAPVTIEWLRTGLNKN